MTPSFCQSAKAAHPSRRAANDKDPEAGGTYSPQSGPECWERHDAGPSARHYIPVVSVIWVLWIVWVPMPGHSMRLGTAILPCPARVDRSTGPIFQPANPPLVFPASRSVSCPGCGLKPPQSWTSLEPSTLEPGSIATRPSPHLPKGPIRLLALPPSIDCKDGNADGVADAETADESDNAPTAAVAADQTLQDDVGGAVTDVVTGRGPGLAQGIQEAHLVEDDVQKGWWSVRQLGLFGRNFNTAAVSILETP
ncbi:hypothetical protein NOR_07791 [Metarhizium rileyi]|uniref:Uncharacterized protein n=1 Tax=Metarhizium rileyi (strain RCEF 4871) TaxID=1649241 RepID=A0A166XG73_METRR|nr:hypothetical protein NOR_07791 [Metarhizium rileyi RCEF 4871]